MDILNGRIDDSVQLGMPPHRVGILHHASELYMLLQPTPPGRSCIQLPGGRKPNSRVEANQFEWSWKETNSYIDEMWTKNDEQCEDTLTMGSAITIR